MPNIPFSFKNHWPFIAVLAAYLLIAALLPIQARAAINDDWIYTKTVEHFLQTGQIKILNMSVASLFFQALWGSLFAWLFSGLLGIFGALRLSTLTLVAISSFFLNFLLCELEIPRSWRALGVAAYLFQPVGFVLTFTFMTDMQLTAMLLIALALFVAGFRRGALNLYTLAASIVTGLAYMVRQPAILFLASVLFWMFLAGQIPLTRRGWFNLVLAAGPAGFIIAGYQYWLIYIHGVPIWQTVFASIFPSLNLLAAGVFGLKFLVIALIYLALFALPLTLAALPGLLALLRKPNTILLFLIACFVILWLALTIQGMRMPYIPHFLNRNGLGPSDLVVGIPPLLSVSQLIWPSIFVFLNGIVLIILLSRLTIRFDLPALFLIILAGQIAAALLPSLASGDSMIDGYNTPGLDRYLLPAMPVVIISVMLVSKRLKSSKLLAWGVVFLFAVFSLAGTHDSLQLHAKIWDLGVTANQMGIENTHLDAGASWDGYYLFDNSLPGIIPAKTPRYNLTYEPSSEPLVVPPPNWWHLLWAPQTDSQVIVSGAPLQGFQLLSQNHFYSWLRLKDIPLYLLRRP